MANLYQIICLFLFCCSILCHDDGIDWETFDENDIDEKDPEYIPDEIEDDDDYELEYETQIAEKDVVKITHVISEIAQTYQSKDGGPWSEDPPIVSDLNEFVFEPVQLMETDVELGEKDIFDTIFTDQIYNKYN